MLRYRLGRSPSGGNIIKNGDFANGFVDWDSTIGWGWSANAATANPAFVADLDQKHVLQRGQWYRMQFRILNPFTKLLIIPAVQKEYRNYGTGDYSFDFQATIPVNNNNAIGFLAYESLGTLTNVELYNLSWNAPITDVNDFDFSYNIERDSDLEGVVTEYMGDVIFSKSGYAYLSSLEGFCQEVPVLIEKFKSGKWKKYIEGVIFLSDVEFDEKKCTARATIEHKQNQSFINGKDSPVDLESATLLNVVPLPNSVVSNVAVHDRNGNYTYTHRNVFNFGRALRMTALYATDLLVDVNPIPFSSGLFQGLAMTTGAELVDNESSLATGISVTGDPVTFSFKDLFSELNKILCLGWMIEEDADGVGMVRIDYKQNFFTSTKILDLENFTEVKRKFYSDIFFRNVKIGYTLARTNSRKLESDSINYYSDIRCTGDSLDLVSGFIQSTTLIRRKLSPITIGTNTATAFSKLVVAGETFLTTIVPGDIVTNTTDNTEARVTFVESNTRLQLSDNIFGSTGKNYLVKSEADSLDSELFILEIDAATAKTRIFANNGFNGNIDPADNAARWVQFFPSSVRTNTGGTYAEIIKTNPPIIYLYEGSTHLNDNDFDLIRDNPIGQIGFTIKGVYKSGWIKGIDRKERSGNCKISIISTE